MKNALLILIILGLVSCGNEQKQEEDHKHSPANAKTSPTSKILSPNISTMEIIDGAHIHIDYSSPSVRDRIIFGGLVGYNQVWQAGAHKATWIETDTDLLIKGKTLPAGKYGFFVIPGKEKWEVMFNTRWNQHGKDDYNEDENVLTLAVTPIELKAPQESLKYEVIKGGNNSGIISLAWEKIKIEVPFVVGK